MALACGCGGGQAFVGSWSADARSLLSAAMQSSVESARLDLSLGPDGSTVQTLVTVTSQMARMRAGCTETTRINGVRWSQRESAGPSVLVFGSATSASVERTGCAQASDNLVQQPTTNPQSFIQGDATWSVMNNVMSLRWMEGTVARMLSFGRL